MKDISNEASDRGMQIAAIAHVSDNTGGKYYSTRLEVELTDGRKVNVELSSDDREPSSWEIENKWDSREDFNRNISDGHYERDATRIVADAVLSLGTECRDKASVPERFWWLPVATVAAGCLAMTGVLAWLAYFGGAR